MLCADKYGFTLQLLEAGQMDHIHCFVSAPPTVPVSQITRELKSITARAAFQRYPYLRRVFRGGHFWNPSCYIETIGSISEDNIRKYISGQQKTKEVKPCRSQNAKKTHRFRTP